MKTPFLLSLALAAALWQPSLGQEPAITVPAFGQAEVAASTAISINGPSTAKPGETVTCTLTGTPPVDLAEPLVDQLDWLMGDDRMFVYVAMPGQAMVPLDVEGTIVFAASGATMRPQVHFGVADPGEYRVLVDWNQGQNQLVEHVVTVGGPSPDPFPQPQPGPIPAGTRLALILHESSTISPQQAAVAESLRRYLSGNPKCLYRLLDQDTPTLGNWGQPYLQEVQRRNLSLPVLVVSVLPDPPTRVEPYFVSVDALPATAEAAVAKVEEALK